MGLLRSTGRDRLTSPIADAWPHAGGKGEVRLELSRRLQVDLVRLRNECAEPHDRAAEEVRPPRAHLGLADRPRREPEELLHDAVTAEPLQVRELLHAEESADQERIKHERNGVIALAPLGRRRVRESLRELQDLVEVPAQRPRTA